MRRVLFFACVLGCGSREPAHVEIAQPLPSVTATAAVAPTATTAPERSRESVYEARDLRSMSKRSPALLRTETQALENLLTATAASSPDRPALLRRLAENWVELRKAGDPSASGRAIRYYKELVTGYPSYAQADEAYYYLALEYELAGDLTNARRDFYELIRRAPTSRLVPYAYFAFGEMFFDEAKSDPSKWDLAQQAYSETLKYPSPIASDAACRLGDVFDAKGDAARGAQWRAKASTPCR